MAERLKRLFTVAAISTVALFGVTACGSSDSAADEPQTETATLDVEQAKTAAEGYIENLSLDIGFPDCDWQEKDTEGQAVLTTVCESDELILVTGDPDAINAYSESMQDSAPGGFAIVGDDYALLAPDKGNALRARDLLGGDGEVVDLS